MAIFSHRGGENDDEEEISEEDDAFDEDMEALRRACMLTGTNHNQIKETLPTDTTIATNSDSEGGTDESDDLELARSIRQRFAPLPLDHNQPLVLKPLSFLPPIASDDDDEDDFETLSAIERRFSKFDSDVLKKNTENHLHKPELVCGVHTPSEPESPKTNFVNRNYSRALGEEFSDSEEACNSPKPLESSSFTGPGNQNQPSGYIEWHRSEDPESSTLPPKYSGFLKPKSAQLFIEAIKKNRSCQKFIRSKLIQIEARIEENKRLRERIKLLKDFQASCKRKAGRALSQKKDARVQLISVRKSRTPRTFKDNVKKVRALYLGPIENSHVANYRVVLAKFPLSLRRQHWSEAAKENLRKGIKQQFQEMMLQKSLDLYSGFEDSFGDSNALDNIIASITDVEITPENVRSFLPKVDWERLASMYVVGRSGAECEARWLNSDDPLINHNSWTNIEDKNLLFILQKRGLYNWIDIATTLGTNRTPFQCLARYQRSLNAHIMKRAWTEDDDVQLRTAVEAFGEHDWQQVASNLEGRTGTQCSNRWKKTLNPARERVGRWTVEEDKRLKVAVTLFGPKTWKKIAQFVPGRTQVQCRERWLNVLDPSLNLGEWTEDEDTMLKAAIAAHGHCWSKVAASIPPRTDSQCRRRWKVLLPHEVPLLQAERRIQKAAFMSNFVDREEERPTLCPSDFLPLPGTNPISESEGGNNNGKEKKKTRRKPEYKQQKDTMVSCNGIAKKSFKRSKSEAEEVLRITNGDVVETICENDSVSKKKANKPRSKKSNDDGVETIGGNDTVSKKVVRKPRAKKNKCAEPALGNQDPPLLPEPLTCMTNGGDVETIGGNDTVSKKARKPRAKKNNKSAESALGHQEPPLLPEHLTCMTNDDDVETIGGNGTISKKKARKPQSKKKKRAESAPGDQDLPLCLEPLACITNGDGVASFTGNDDVSKRKARMSCAKKNKCVVPAPCHQAVSLFLQPSTCIPNDDNDESFAGVDTSSERKNFHKPPSKGKRCAELVQDHQGTSSSLKHLKLSRTTNGNHIEILGGDNTTKKRKAPISRLKRGTQEHQVLVTTSSSSNMLGSESIKEHQPHDANGVSVFLRVENEHPGDDLVEKQVDNMDTGEDLERRTLASCETVKEVSTNAKTN